MERKQPRWEKAQSVFHKDEKGEAFLENAYGSLKYTKEESDQRSARKGFVLEAKEAPGTAGHTEKEKHLKPETMKKVKMREGNMQGERFLYTSGIPFRDQAIFYDVSEWERSREFLDCLKNMMEIRSHRTIRDTFGFLEQGSEQMQKKVLEQERMQELSLDEFERVNHRIDSLNDQLQKKKTKEQQMRADLQLMIDRRKAEEREGREERAYEKPAAVWKPDGNQAETEESRQETGQDTAEDTEGGVEEPEGEKEAKKKPEGEEGKRAGVKV